ncbi:MAG: anthranilate synthase component II [Candidatus Hermodarchaeota archaeon]
MRGLLIDNYDSFTYNLYQYLGELESGRIDVARNDQITLDMLEKAGYDYFVISPGPGHPANPRDFGICADILRSLAKYIPTLGICLGHQGIGHYYGAKIVRSSYPMHGKTSIITHDREGVFYNLPNPISAARYHSLVIDPTTIPEHLKISAKTQDGVVMAIRHKQFPIIGIQFHPESILTGEGKNILKNFLNMVK